MATPVTVPMVGKIVSVSVKVGDQVKEDDQVAVLEAMKMEMPLVAPVSGVVETNLRLCRPGGGGGGDHCNYRVIVNSDCE